MKSSSPALLNALDEVVRITELEGARRSQLLDLSGRERHFRGLEVVLELFDRSRSEDHRGHRGPSDEPGHRHSSGRGAKLFGDRSQGVDDPPAPIIVVAGPALFPFVEAGAWWRRLVSAVFSAQKATAER